MDRTDEFVGLIRQNEGIIYKITRAYTDEPHDQKDLYQDIVFQLWKSYPSFKGASKVSTWIYRIALNTSITHSKKGGRTTSSIALDFDVMERHDEQSEHMQERVEIMYAHIKKLSIIEKGIVLLYFEGKSHAEIAEITGFTTSNIGTRLSRIKNKLKNQILNN